MPFAMATQRGRFLFVGNSNISWKPPHVYLMCSWKTIPETQTLYSSGSNAGTRQQCRCRLFKPALVENSKIQTNSVLKRQRIYAPKKKLSKIQPLVVKSSFRNPQIFQELRIYMRTQRILIFISVAAVSRFLSFLSTNYLFHVWDVNLFFSRILFGREI